MFKKIVTSSVLAISALSVLAANATTPGPYVNVEMGYVHTKNKFLKPLPSKDTKYQGGLIGRLSVGYQFSPYWALEAGYLQLAKQKSNLSVSANDAVTLKQHAFDVAGKGILPISDKFNLYAKAGMAYLINNVNNAQIVAPIAKYNWAPEAGVGVTYNISNNVFVDTAYTHIHPIGKNKPSNIDFATVGIGYSFG
ncbi:MAG: hypothetical protein CFE62_001455 [Candidatus Aquirickettsiella gammari]|uniref:Outer membrane protein beta-barrel domain-containing protein n=1 Tax=Candidatus Aquirickettsiella gammari TaxID=2016198 RepID=A0A370CKZ5_9COXI|nr:MAG: hypothetical protein CFE62_001455 [Candidatus Aquirickettsiella gammari]